MSLDWVGVGLLGNLIVNGASKLYDVIRQKQVGKKQDETIIDSRNFQRNQQLVSIETQRHLIYESHVLAVELHERREILERYPLTLHPSQIYKMYENIENTGQPTPISVLIAPPKLRNDHVSHIDASNFPNTELMLIEYITDKLSEYVDNKLIDIKSGIWKGNQFYGESAVAYLHQMFCSLPMLVIDSNIEGDYLYLHAGFWGSGSQEYVYKQLGKFSLSDMLNFYARRDAENWALVREGYTSEGRLLTNDEQRVHEANLKILKEQALTESNETDWVRTFNYNSTRDHLEQITVDIAILHVAVIGWIADAFHLEELHRLPRLPKLLNEMVGNSPILDQFLSIVIDGYNTIYDRLQSFTPHWLPLLHLELAQSLTVLDSAGTNYSQQKLKDAFVSWFKVRDIPVPDEMKFVEKMVQYSELNNYVDLEDLHKFKEFFIAINDTDNANQIAEYLQNSTIPGLNIPAYSYKPAFLSHIETEASMLANENYDVEIDILGDQFGVVVWLSSTHIISVIISEDYDTQPLVYQLKNGTLEVVDFEENSWKDNTRIIDIIKAMDI